MNKQDLQQSKQQAILCKRKLAQSMKIDFQLTMEEVQDLIKKH